MQSPNSAATPARHVIDATHANFDQDVIEASKTTPVLVDLWAEWCGPCKALGPILEKLAGEYNGGFILAKVNVDEEQALAAAFGVRSIPMVVLIKDGQPVDAFTGALPEGQVRQFLAGHDVQPGSQLAGVDAPAAEDAAPAEAPADAVARIRAEMEASPDDQERVFDLVQALLRAGELEEARAALANLPVNLDADARARRLRDQVDLADSLANAPAREELEARLARDADDHEARDLLGVRLLMSGENQAGLDQFLTLLERARDWNDGRARQRLIAAFGMLGDDPLVGEYRRRMSRMLF